jgi:hypothetical protein
MTDTPTICLIKNLKTDQFSTLSTIGFNLFLKRSLLKIKKLLAQSLRD